MGGWLHLKPTPCPPAVGADPDAAHPNTRRFPMRHPVRLALAMAMLTFLAPSLRAQGQPNLPSGVPERRPQQREHCHGQCPARSEEHTSEVQSHLKIVSLLLPHKTKQR